MNELLADDHAELGNLLGKVFAALDADEVALSHASLDLFWARLAVHIRAEHLHVFPAVENAFDETHTKGLSAGEALKVIEELRSDHDFFMSELSEAVVITRNLVKSVDRQADVQRLQHVRAKVATVEARLAKHNRVEEEGVYLWTSSLLSETEQTALAARVQKELENMPPRFGIRSTS
ncbi:MAG TPA: hemerythrin domain-containing protein [Pyrinomonadaceae bacterium]